MSGQSLHRITDEGQPEILHPVAQRGLKGRARPMSNVRSAEKQGQFRGMVRPLPWPRRDVGKVSGVEVAECGNADSVAVSRGGK